MFKRSLHNYDDEIEGDMLTSVESVQKGETSVLINVAKLQKKIEKPHTAANNTLVLPYLVVCRVCCHYWRRKCKFIIKVETQSRFSLELVLE